MKTTNKLLILGLVLFTVVGCGKVPTLKNGEEAVTTLKEGNISADQLYSEIKTKYGAAALVDLIDHQILDKKYKEDDDLKDYIKEQEKQIKDSAKQNNVSYEYLLNYYGYSDEDAFKDSLALNYRRNLAVNDYLEERVSDKEMKTYYDESIKGDIKAKHILIKPNTTSEMTSEEQKKAEEKALNKAKDIINKLNKGEKWDDLAKKYSEDDTNNEKGGDLGWIKTGDMVSEFENAAWDLKKGKYSATPVKTTYGYHIIYKTDEKAKPKLDEVKDKVIEKVVSQKLSADAGLYYETLNKVRKQSDLKIVDSELSKLYKQLVESQENSARSQQQQAANNQ